MASIKIKAPDVNSALHMLNIHTPLITLRTQAGRIVVESPGKAPESFAEPRAALLLVHRRLRERLEEIKRHARDIRKGPLASKPARNRL